MRAVPWPQCPFPIPTFCTASPHPPHCTTPPAAIISGNVPRAQPPNLTEVYAGCALGEFPLHTAGAPSSAVLSAVATSAVTMFQLCKHFQTAAQHCTSHTAVQRHGCHSHPWCVVVSNRRWRNCSGRPSGGRIHSWTCPQAATFMRLESGSCAMPQFRSVLLPLRLPLPLHLPLPLPPPLPLPLLLPLVALHPHMLHTFRPLYRS